MSDVTERYSVDIFHQLFAPYYPIGYRHDEDALARNHLVVVLIDDEALQQTFGREWPLRYADHARILRRLLEHQPAAVFYDILFKQRRIADDTHAQLSDVIRRYRDAGVPLVFATDGLDPYWRTDAEPLPRVHDGAEPADGLLRGAELATVTWPRTDDTANTYPHCVDSRGCAMPTAAFALGERARFLSRAPRQPLHVDWGAVAPPRTPCHDADTLHAPAARLCLQPRTECPTARPSWWALPGALLRRAGGPASQLDCFYHCTIQVGALLDPSRHGCTPALMRRQFADRTVLVGAALTGIPDVVESPVHGRIPGVFMHAMALDNLRTYGARYKGHWRPPVVDAASGLGTDETVSLVLVSLFVVFFVAYERGARRLADAYCPHFLARRAAGPGGADGVADTVVSLLMLLATVGLTIVTLALLLSLYVQFGMAPIDWIGALLVATIAARAPDLLPGMLRQGAMTAAIGGDLAAWLLRAVWRLAGAVLTLVIRGSRVCGTHGQRLALRLTRRRTQGRSQS